MKVLTHDFSRFPQNWQKLLRASLSVPLVPEAFHARFPVFFLAVRAFGQRPKTCLPPADEAPRRSRKKTSGTQVSISDQKYRKVSQRGHVRVSPRAHAGHILSASLVRRLQW